ncbi:MAG: PilW family protein [Methylovulum sp.]|nr:PilW family protein [Methylovulum sp.]
MKNSCPKYAQSGLTLIELMIAMLLGVFLIGGVVQIFVSSKQTYRMQEGLSRLQENGRFAMDFISRDLRMAGYREINVANYTQCLNYTVPSPITGVDDTGLNGSDTISLQLSPSVCTGVPVPITITYSIQPGVGGRPGLQKATNPVDANSDGELVEDVENMQILYGDDANGDFTPDYYVPFGTPGLNMARVVSIRVSLLLRSSENLAAQPLPYNFNGVTITPAATDRTIRRVFTSTIALRNRLS